MPLVSAREKEQALVTLCSACHNVIKQVNHDMQTDADIQMKANNYMKLETPYTGETEVLHYLEVLRDKIGFDKVTAAVKNPLKGKKIAAYYGCLLRGRVRYCKWIIRKIRKFWRISSGRLVQNRFSIRREMSAAGGYMTMEEKSVAVSRSSAVMDSAKEFGAEMVITACPLCLYNLKKNSGFRAACSIFH